MDDGTAIHTAIRSGPLYYDFIIKPPQTYEEAMTRARYHADAGEANLAKKKEEGPPNYDKLRDQRQSNRPGKPKERSEKGPRFTPLNRPVMEVFRIRRTVQPTATARANSRRRRQVKIFRIPSHEGPRNKRLHGSPHDDRKIDQKWTARPICEKRKRRGLVQQCLEA